MKPDHSFNIATAPKRNSRHWTNSTITWGELVQWAENPADHRECGNYILGRLNGARRAKTTIESRSALTLDLDYADKDFLPRLEHEFPYSVIAHTTWRSTPDAPRYRLIVVVDRDLAPDEYDTAVRALMQQLGEEQFDPQSPQPERYMFRPSTQDPEHYDYRVLEKTPAPADELLESFVEDLSTLPLPRPSRSKRNPFEIEGTIGAFNTVYEDLDHLIQEYDLPYDHSGSDRWHLVGAASAAGMGPVAPGLWFSHHSNDPAGGRACSAFDLARLHLYGELDEDLTEGTPVNRAPSHVEMLKRAASDPAVIRQLVGGDFSQEMDAAEKEILGDFAEESGSESGWVTALMINPKTGKPEDTVHNWDLILKHDPVFNGLYFNEMTMAIESRVPLPWRANADDRLIDGRARSAMALYLERQYNMRISRSYLDDLLAEIADRHRMNPVRDYLKGLVWDGEPRVETCLPGVLPTPYTRTVARKVMTAAVARMMDPGCKWDHMLVIYGKEGLGKSWWINRLARGFSGTLGRITDKDTLIAMQSSWIMVSDEGHTMRKADFDAQKEFITRQSDILRMPYDREAVMRPRHCVIWGTTNDETFLRRQEGNRRFLIVESQEHVDFDALTDAYIDQLWAEAVVMYRRGEPLFFNDEENVQAAAAREEFTEEDAVTGQIQEYLETLVPEDWEDMSPLDRLNYLQGVDDFRKGVKKMDVVCSKQIWFEALGNRHTDGSRADLKPIVNALKSIPGWTLQKTPYRVKGYGPQRVFTRDPEDLL